MANLPKHTIPIDKKFFTTAFEKKGMSQNEVAEKLGIDKSAMSLMLSGKRKMTVAEAMQLAQMLDKSIETILIRSGGLRAKKK